MSLSPEKLEAAVLEAFAAERRQLLPVVNLVRLALLTAFLLLALVVSGAAESAAWEQRVAPMCLYLGAAVLLLLLGRMGTGFAGLVENSIWLFDVPLMFIVQADAMSAGGSQGEIAAFSAGLLLFLIMVSTLTLDERQIFLATMAGIGAEITLQLLAGETVAGMLAGAGLLMAGGLLCQFARQRRLELIARVVGEQLKRDRLARYLSPEVVNRILSIEEDVAVGKAVEVSVLFCDLRGFTAMSSGLSGPETVDLLNDFHTRMVGAVFQNGGTLDKYLGDGLMAYFGAPLPVPDHAMKAVRCARDMVAELDEMNDGRERRGLARLRMGIGIHSGEVVLGSIGAPQRMDFTVVGDTVNLASRMESLTKESEVGILISERTRELAGDSTFFQPMPELHVRGRSAPMRVFSVKPPQSRF